MFRSIKQTLSRPFQDRERLEPDHRENWTSATLQRLVRDELGSPQLIVVSAPKATFFLTVFHGNSEWCWKTMPRLGPGRTTSSPSIRERTDLSVTSPADDQTYSAIVVLDASLASRWRAWVLRGGRE